MTTVARFAPGTPEAGMLEQLRTLNVHTSDVARAGLVVSCARRNPGLTEWPAVLKHAVRVVQGDVERVGGVIYNCCTQPERWDEAAAEQRRAAGAQTLIDRIRGESAQIVDPGKGLPSAPQHCTAANPYGWRRLPAPGEDHSRPGEWNAWRQCRNGPYGEREERPTNGDHPKCCFRLFTEDDEDWIARVPDPADRADQAGAAVQGT